jgi:hypothetical protein
MPILILSLSDSVIGLNSLHDFRPNLSQHFRPLLGYKLSTQQQRTHGGALFLPSRWPDILIWALPDVTLILVAAVHLTD